MRKSYSKEIKNRGMSAIIVTLLLVMLTVVLIGVVWGVINSMIHKQISSSEACYSGLSSMVTIDNKYTCYNSSSQEVQVSLNVGSVDLDGIVVAINGNSDSGAFTLMNQSSQISGVTNYSGGTLVQTPGKNSGETYFYSWAGKSGSPDSIEISPVRDGQTCSSSDKIDSLSDCSLLY